MEHFINKLKSHIQYNKLDLMNSRDFLSDKLEYLSALYYDIDLRYILMDITIIYYNYNDALTLKWLKYFPNILTLHCEYNKLNADSLRELKHVPKLTTLHIEHNKIENLSNLEFVPNLVDLCCHNNEIFCLPDLPNLRANIQMFDCRYNKLLTTSIVDWPKLEKLYLDYNLLVSVCVSRCDSLGVLGLGHNRLTELIIQNLPHLSQLHCDHNYLVILKIDCKSLGLLDFSNNHLKKINLQDLINVYTISCSDNLLTDLDLTKCKKLIILMCDRNRLIKLNLSTLTDISDVYCSFNRLSTLEVDNCKKLSKLDCAHNQLTRLNLSSCSCLMSLKCKNNHILNIDDILISSKLVYFSHDLFFVYTSYEGSDECCICFDTWTSKNLDASKKQINEKITTTCKHIFHRVCLSTWLDKYSMTTCPCCRQLCI